MVSEQSGWIKIAAAVDEIPFDPNNIAEWKAADRHICIAKYKTELFVFAPKCPHAGGRFADGFIDALGNIVCPLHRYKFCLKNGYNISGEGYCLKRWPVAVRPDGVFVQLITGALF